MTLLILVALVIVILSDDDYYTTEKYWKIKIENLNEENFIRRYFCLSHHIINCSLGEF